MRRRPAVLAGIAAALVTACLAVYLMIIGQQDGGGPAWWYVALLAFVIVLLAAVAAGLAGPAGRWILLLCAGILGLATLLGLLSIGLLLVPALVLTVIASTTLPEPATGSAAGSVAGPRSGATGP